MNSNDYQKDATVTDLMDYGPVVERLMIIKNLRLLHGAMGCCTETGELMDALKRFLFYGKQLDFINLQEECGDLFWYIALIADAIGFTFENTYEKNIAKLKARYPNKFTEHDALNQLKNGKYSKNEISNSRD
jgi:NTP pyrophosphatase (non-canonical NTP hydrolase)